MFSAPGCPQVSPNGPEFQVNAYTTSYQFFAAAAADGLGNFIVTWESKGSSGTDHVGYSIQAQRYEANGVGLGNQFQVNTFATSDQEFPTVGADAQGNFVVAWMSWGSSGSDTSLTSIQAQRFDANGMALGGQFQVNTSMSFYQNVPAAAVAGDGDFIIVWKSDDSNGTDTDSGSIQAQRYDANGIALGEEFQVNTYTTSGQGGPRVAVDGQGNSVVVWESGSSTGDNFASVQMQLYDANGNPAGGEVQVNTYTSSFQVNPVVAASPTGAFVVVWQSGGSSGTDTLGWSVQAQRYAADGVPLGAEFQVNTYTTGDQLNPVVTSDATGSFIVIWESIGSTGTDSSDRSIQGRRYDANGSPSTGEFQVNSYTTSGQRFPAVTTDPQGNFLAVWHSSGSSGTDTSATSIQAQRYDGLFRDGFESGNSSRWSVTVSP